MRVISLVPSWTETLIDSGVNVVGRTRFCIHPQGKVEPIPTVGGTKEVDWKKIHALAPDVVLMDKEENTQEMAANCPFPVAVTHVLSMADLPLELTKLSERFANERLKLLAKRWSQLLLQPQRKAEVSAPPGLVQWLTPPPVHLGPTVYLIWNKPWMAAGPNTFIGSVMKWCGWEIWGDKKYPEFELDAFGAESIFLCSTEPYPFAKRPQVTSQLPGAVALIDGEKISWFGLRTLQYLESLLR